MDEWKDNYLLEAIITACDYNCLIEEIITWKDKIKSKYDHVCISPNSQEEFIYMICVLLFGEYGCSPRTGWIEDIEGFHNFIDKFIEHYEEYKTYGRYDDKALQKEEEKIRIEFEPDMDRCHFIKSEHCVGTNEYINWYVYNDVPIKEITTYLSWRHEIIYEVNYNDTRYVYLDLEDACKFIENKIILHG